MVGDRGVGSRGWGEYDDLSQGVTRLCVAVLETLNRQGPHSVVDVSSPCTLK